MLDNIAIDHLVNHIYRDQFWTYDFGIWSCVPVGAGSRSYRRSCYFSGEISFGGKKIRQSYEAVARFQLENRAGNHDFLDREVKKGNGTWAAEKRELTHCIEGRGERQEGSVTLIKEKGQRGWGIEDEG